jgi:hypothetical protein
MSPLPIHEVLKTYFAYLLAILAEELGIPVRCLGSTTYRRQGIEHGIEPDQSFYLNSLGRVREWDPLDLAVNPPPDLAIEVEITTTILNRIAIYAALGVPELWRCDEEELRVLRLTPAGVYEAVPASVALPFLPMNEVLPLFGRLREEASDDGHFMRSLRAWVRERVRPLWEAAQSTAPAPPACNNQAGPLGKKS